MKKLFHIILVTILCSDSMVANAQADSAANNVSFKIGVYYNSNLHYYGRTDSLGSSGIFPMAELWFNNRFYVNAAPVFTANNSTGFQYAGTVATLGYLNNNGKSATHLYFVKPIYKNNSHLVQSALKAQLAGSFTWLNTLINITGGGDLKFTDNVDYGASLGFDHIFKEKLFGNTLLMLDPSVNLYAGTQRFTQTRFKNNDFLFLPGPGQEVSEEVNKFRILSYEFSVPVILARGKWLLLATPAWVAPQNLVKVEGRPDLTEKGKSLVYITVGVKLSL